MQCVSLRHIIPIQTVAEPTCLLLLARCLPLPTLGAMLATMGELTEFRVALNGNRGSVTLIYGEEDDEEEEAKRARAGAGGGGGTGS